MSGLTGNNILAGSSGQVSGYEIEHSLRFNNTGESVYLERTPSADGNKQVATLSFWIKNCGVSDSGGTDNTKIMYAGNSSSDVSIWQVTHTSAKFEINNYRSGPGNGYWTTDAQYRDPGAWYHYVVSYNQGTVNTYVNGELQSQSVTIGGWSGAVDTAFNSNGVLMVVGPKTTTASVKSIYLAEYHWIDGQALTPSDFGETNADTNQWVPIKYAGSYGTNGFYLNFSDSASLGADSSGNGNNFTPTNLAATDQVLDSPTNNFATLNPLFISTYSTHTFNEGNLRWHSTSDSMVDGSIGMSSGKWYWEVYQEANNSNTTYFGISDSSSRYVFAGEKHTVLNANVIAGGDFNTSIIKDGTSVQSGLADFEIGHILGIAYDADNLEIDFYLNGSQIGVTQSVTSPDSGVYVPMLLNGNGAGIKTAVMNFGQDSSFAGNKTAQNNTDANGIGDFYYTPPSGYLALCEDNLPDPSIALPGEHFNTVTYSGNATQGHSITGVGFQPDFSWLKGRSTTGVHGLWDVVRGATKYLVTNNTDAETTDTTNGLQTFESDGFTLGSVGTWNTSSASYVAWNWKADNTSGSSNTDGTITSTVSANTTAGFSIVSYTGTGANATVGHGLSQRPDMFIVKNRSASARSWVIWTESFSGSQAIEFDLSGVVTSTTSWNSSLPTSTVINLGTRVGTNESGQTFIAYCFHSVEGYSKFGSYKGNGSANGSFVYTGFRPAFVMIKRTDSTGGWSMADSARPEYNPAVALQANTTVVEFGSDLDITSNGFKVRTTWVERNASGGTYIYMAFAESPFKYSNAR